MFPWLFMILVALNWCLHIWGSRHLFQSLKTSFSRQNPLPVSPSRDPEILSGLASWVLGLASMVPGSADWQAWCLGSFVPRSMGWAWSLGSLGWVWCISLWWGAWDLCPNGKTCLLGPQGSTKAPGTSEMSLTSGSKGTSQVLGWARNLVLWEPAWRPGTWGLAWT